MNRLARKLLLGFFVVFVIGTTTAFYAYRDREFDLAKSLDIFLILFRELNYYYVDETNPSKLIEKGIEGMLESLDPYTQYIPESEMEDFRFQTTGEYGGIGALIRRTDQNAMIAEPYEGYPAARAGLKAGDIILEIDGKSTKSKELPDISNMLKGTPGTEVILRIRQGKDGKEINRKLIREKINIPNVPFFGMMDHETGYIRLSNFTANASKEVRNAVLDLKSMGARSLILDLRNNPGGLLMEAVKIAEIFVPPGKEIVSTKGKIKQFDSRYITSALPVDTIIPLVVLTSRGSASASEIVAGSLQDLDRAVIVGQRTFGKGLVQTTRPIKYNTQLKVTTAKYYTPSGRCIQAVDYSHRNEDGSVGFIPDSLIREFKTSTGRKVYDGGGIQPDIKSEPQLLSKISTALITSNLSFDFATWFASKKDSIPHPFAFSLSDKDYKDFIDFALHRDFSYQTESEIKLRELEAAVKREKYFEESKSELDKLKNLLSHDKEKDLLNFKDEIIPILEEEIVGRYYFQKGRIQYSIFLDNQVEDGLKILKDPVQYSSILTGKTNNQNISYTHGRNDLTSHTPGRKE